jgi:hypothetical protein
LRDGKPRALPKEDAAAAAAEAAASALPIVAEMVDVFNRRARGIKRRVQPPEQRHRRTQRGILKVDTTFCQLLALSLPSAHPPASITPRTASV